MKKYDLVVIGTGASASSPAYLCRGAGWKVAVVDKNPFGGTCALRGCDPKKVLVGAADIMDSIKRMQGKGIDPGSTLNWEDLMAFKRTFTDPVPGKNEKAYEEAGIEMYHGTASFISHNQLQVNGEQMEFGHLLIASGARPQPLKIIGEEHVRTSDDFLELEHLPDRLVFIGGGYISFEFAHIAARAGAEVHIIHRSANPLKHFDQDLVAQLVKRSREVGIQVHLDTQPESIEKDGEGYVVHAKRNGEAIRMECDMVFHGAGRIPDIDALDLDTGNVKGDRKGIAVNEFLQSVSNPLVYAAGDAAATRGLPLTPVGAMESIVAAANMMEGNHKKPDYEVMPSVVFTQPKLAMVGMTEEEAIKNGIEVDVNLLDTSGWAAYRRINDPHAMVKILKDRKTGEIIGAHVLGSDADVLINTFALIMKFHLPADEVRKMIFGYPTTTSNLSYML